MVCLRCNGNNDGNNTVCAHCGADMHINIKTRGIAVKLYNKGLALAKERKLSDAAEAINKSLYFDRFNIDARNVLGLIYLELGMIADALKQWAISASYYGENNLAKVYLARIKDNVREMERMDDAVKMYNQGLINIKNKNDDMAVIQLKKAIEQNPKLVEAKNLLSLIYMQTNNSQAAIQLVDVVRAHDVSNRKAIGYGDTLGRPILSSSQKYKQIQQTKTNASTIKQNEIYIQKKVKRFGRFPLSEVVSLIIGAACAVAVMYFLVIPSIEASGKEGYESLQSSIASMQQAHEKAIAEKDAELEQLTEKNAELERINEEMASRGDVLEKQQKIMTAVSLHAAGNIKESAAIIKDLDTSGLGDVEMSQYNSIREVVFPLMAKTSFDDGRAAYNAQQYDEAKTAFLLGLEYGMTEANAGDAYYYLGRMAENDDDLVIAKQYYERVTEEYGAATQYRNATSRLNSLNR